MTTRDYARTTGPAHPARMAAESGRSLRMDTSCAQDTGASEVCTVKNGDRGQAPRTMGS